MNQESTFLGGSFNTRDNVSVPIQFDFDFERWFCLKNRLIHLRINSTSFIRLVKWNKSSFSGIDINKPLPVLVHSVS